MFAKSLLLVLIVLDKTAVQAVVRGRVLLKLRTENGTENGTERKTEIYINICVVFIYILYIPNGIIL